MEGGYPGRAETTARLPPPEQDGDRGRDEGRGGGGGGCPRAPVMPVCKFFPVEGNGSASWRNPRGRGWDHSPGGLLAGAGEEPFLIHVCALRKKVCCRPDAACGTHGTEPGRRPALSTLVQKSGCQGVAHRRPHRRTPALARLCPPGAVLPGAWHCTALHGVARARGWCAGANPTVTGSPAALFHRPGTGHLPSDRPYSGADIPAHCVGGRRSTVFRAIADVLRSIGGAIATVVTLPFRALARLFGGASSSAHGRH